MPSEPEQIARAAIDRMLAQFGWAVQDYRAVNISASTGVAVREFPLKTGFADYLFYADGKAIAVVEAKPKGYALRGVETRQIHRRPSRWPAERLPLVFAYESTGTLTQFASNLDLAPRSREVFFFSSPRGIVPPRLA